MFCLHAYVHARCFMRPKQDFGSPGIELQMVVSHPVSVRTKPGYSVRTANALSH